MSLQLNKNNYSTYKLNKNDSQLYIFELILNRFNNKSKTFKKIKKSFSGQLLYIDDNINYNDIKKINLSVIDINDPTEIININCNLNHFNNCTEIFNDQIHVKFSKINNNLECTYDLITNL